MYFCQFKRRTFRRKDDHKKKMDERTERSFKKTYEQKKEKRLNNNKYKHVSLQKLDHIIKPSIQRHH